jgi:signal transduction histidine kinase/CheY-like chemotaxis protein
MSGAASAPPDIARRPHFCPFYDFLRFLPPEPQGKGQKRARARWWFALIAGGPGWIVPGMLKLLAGSFLATLALDHGLSPNLAAQPVGMYRVAFGYVLPQPMAALVLASVFIVISQFKINVANAYAGSIAWSNFFARLTHSHPGRVVWLIFNIAIALLLMELGVYQTIERTLALYSGVAAAWMGALVADLVVNKPLRLSPPRIEFKRAHLHDINPVGVGGMLFGVALAACAYAGLFGRLLQALSPFLGFVGAFTAAPVIAFASRGRFYLARKPRAGWAGRGELACVICAHAFEPEDMAFCPAYAGPICSLCCSLDARCEDSCKPRSARGFNLLVAPLRLLLPARAAAMLGRPLARYLAIVTLFALALAGILFALYTQTATPFPAMDSAIAAAFRKMFFVLLVIAGIAAWLLVLALESRRVAQEESRRQTELLMREIGAHRRTDAKLQKAKEAAEAANHAKSRYVVGISHELRTPLNAILGYAQLLEADVTIPPARHGAIRVMRQSAEHLAGLIEGLLDISKIEAGRIELYRDEVHLGEFLDQITTMFRPQAEARGIRFVHSRPDHLPEAVFTDERRLRQILINLLSNAIKFTAAGDVGFHFRQRGSVAEFEIADTGCGIAETDRARIFEPFQRVEARHRPDVPGIGLGLTITRLLVQIMGGEIAVVSQPGAGSRFTVRLMLSEVREPRRPPAPERRPVGYAGRRRLVLVADDDPPHRWLMRDALTPLGFIVLEAGDGAESLRLAADCRPDAFLLDLSMPGISGWDLARRLRNSGHESAAILIISANAGDLRAGPPASADPTPCHDDVLAKPVSIAALLARLGTLLGLEWQDAAPSAESSPPPQTLAPEVIADLMQLGRIGYVRGILGRLDEIAGATPAADIAPLRHAAAECRLGDFLALLAAAAPP